jgi:hypothetical protein
VGWGVHFDNLVLSSLSGGRLVGAVTQRSTDFAEGRQGKILNAVAKSMDEM